MDRARGRWYHGAMQDTDIEGLGPQEAREYVLAFLTTLKQTEKDAARIREELELWTRRVGLAEGKGDAALAAAARSKAEELAAKNAGLEADVLDLRAKVGVLRQKLMSLQATGGRLVDTDLLLAQLQMLAGEKDALAEKFKKEAADASLSELKKKMQK
jgi:hypothetical protein